MSKRKADTLSDATYDNADDDEEKKDTSASKRIATEAANAHAITIWRANAGGDCEGAQQSSFQASHLGVRGATGPSLYAHVLHVIFAMLGFWEYAGACRVNKLWNAASRHRDWRGNWSVGIYYPIGLARLVPCLSNHITELELVGLRCVSALKLLHHFPRVHRLTTELYADSFEEVFLPSYFTYPPALATLIVTIHAAPDMSSMDLPDLRLSMPPPRLNMKRLFMNFKRPSAMFHPRYGRPTLLLELFPNLELFHLKFPNDVNSDVSIAFWDVLRKMKKLISLRVPDDAKFDVLFANDLTSIVGRDHADDDNNYASSASSTASSEEESKRAEDLALFPCLTEFARSTTTWLTTTTNELRQLQVQAPRLKTLCMRDLLRCDITNLSGFSNLVHLHLHSQFVYPRYTTVPIEELDQTKLQDRRSKCIDARDLLGLARAPYLHTLVLRDVWLGCCKKPVGSVRCACIEVEAQNDPATIAAVNHAGIAFLSSLLELEALSLDGCCLHDALETLCLPKLHTMYINQYRRVVVPTPPNDNAAAFVPIVVLRPPPERMPLLQNFNFYGF